MTAYLTEYFASYLFGHHELMRMRATKSGLYEPLPEQRYCAIAPDGPEPEPEVEPDLGKNIYALKIWLPEKIKDGIRSRADRAGVTLGEFSRALICTHLLGIEYWLKVSGCSILLPALGRTSRAKANQFLGMNQTILQPAGMSE